jgi:hypothetical protein
MPAPNLLVCELAKQTNEHHVTPLPTPQEHN